MAEFLEECRTSMRLRRLGLHTEGNDLSHIEYFIVSAARRPIP
jgi:hypothetical protein